MKELFVGAIAMIVLSTPHPASGEEPATLSVDHSAWDTILKRHVDENGMVAYQALGREDAKTLEAYLVRLAVADPDKMSEPDRIAFWINAYNAGIVAAILDGYSPESTFSRARLFRWYSFAAGGDDRTPSEIEHEILRKEFREPRIHFALVCGATSCPKLRREAYRGDVLGDQLDDQARGFLSNPKRNRIDPHSGVVRFSSIFEWFEEDFVAAAGSLGAYVSRYVDDPAKRALLGKLDDSRESLPYDWTLNAQAE